MKSPADRGPSLEGSFQIRNKKYEQSDLVLRPRGASSRESTPIVLYPRTDWKCLTWKLAPADEGARLINHFTSKTFQPQGAPKDGDTSVAVVQVAPAGQGQGGAEQRWKFVPADGKSYRIVHAATGWVLTAEKEGDEVHIVIAPWTDRDEQKWQVLDGPKHFSG